MFSSPALDLGCCSSRSFRNSTTTQTRTVGVLGSSIFRRWCSRPSSRRRSLLTRHPATIHSCTVHCCRSRYLLFSTSRGEAITGSCIWLIIIDHPSCTLLISFLLHHSQNIFVLFTRFTRITIGRMSRRHVPLGGRCGSLSSSTQLTVSAP